MEDIFFSFETELLQHEINTILMSFYLSFMYI